VDLPRPDERLEVFRIHLNKRGRAATGFDLAALAAASEQFSGAEIEEAINSALYDAFYAPHRPNDGPDFDGAGANRAAGQNNGMNRSTPCAVGDGRARNASVPRMIQANETQA